MEQRQKNEQTTKGIMYPDIKNRSYRVNVRISCWDNTGKLWCGKIKELELAKRISDIAFFLTGNVPFHNTEAYKKVLPVDNDDLRLFRTREEFLEYVKSIAKGSKNMGKRNEFKNCVNSIMAMFKQDYEERAKEVAKIVEKPLPISPNRRIGLPLSSLPAVASSSCSEGLCEDDMEVVDQLITAEIKSIDDDMDEAADDALVCVPPVLEANSGDVCAGEVAAKASGTVESQAMDEGDQNEDLLRMISGVRPPNGSPPVFELAMAGQFMDKGDEDYVYVPKSCVHCFRPNRGKKHQTFTCITSSQETRSSKGLILDFWI